MARTVDPERHAARRLHIVDAALTCFAAAGYHGTTTAAICREARIGSGTFFHYFPTKQDVLLAILDLGSQETDAWFTAQEGRDDARQVLVDHVVRESHQLSEPRLAGFVQAVGSVMGEPLVARALERDQTSVHGHLARWAAAAQSAGEVRTDLPAERLAGWLVLLLDGYTGQVATPPAFDADAERAVLLEQVAALLDGPGR